jgi:outer membrane protein OmpA-like peptidoglycan-associated protein
MKKILLSAIALLTGISSINAQTANHLWGAQINLGTKDYYGEAGSGMLFNDVNINPQIRIARYLSPSFDLGLAGSFGRYDFSNPDSTAVGNPFAFRTFRSTTWDLNLNTRYKFNNGYILKENAFIQPYLTLGVGYNAFKSRASALDTAGRNEGGLNIPVGGGFNFALSKRFSLNLQSTYNFNNVDEYDNASNLGRNNDKYLYTSIGATYNFGPGKAVDTDRDGVPDDQDKCPGTAKGTKVDKDGCPVIAETTIKQVKEIASHIYFETNSDKLKEESKKDLDLLVQILNLNKQIKIDVQGHTDNVGDAAYNMELSQKRANAVRQYLINKGIAPDRVSAKGYGETKPVASNDTPEGKAKNRRVELVLHY